METIKALESFFDENFYKYRFRELKKDAYRFTVAYSLEEEIRTVNSLITEQERLRRKIDENIKKLVFSAEEEPYLRNGIIHLGSLLYSRFGLHSKQDYLIILCHHPKLLKHFHIKSISECFREEKMFNRDALPWYRRWIK
ncbi:hypothetical protein J4436_01770 [Candidatus Woesearchaeota archaeon]|nr:hypothetical protein [Candidatus Woesearchaeota archaeon]